jgi:hypothetical protein
VRPEPILIHNADYYYSQGPCGPDSKSSTAFDERPAHNNSMEHGYHSKNKRCNKNLESWGTRSDAEKDDAQLFKHEALLGVDLLKSCRQMYHETVSILYSKNTFVVSQVRGRHERSEIRARDREDRRDCHQLSYPPMWLASLGAQIRRLKKVVIDISDYPFSYHNAIPDVLPLLRMIWDGILLQYVISFAHTGRRTGIHPRFKDPQDLVATTTRLNKTLDALARDNTLHLRRHSTSTLLMSSFGIS